MNISKQSKASLRTFFAVVIAAMVIVGLASAVCHAGPPSVASSQTNSVESNASSPDTNNVAVKAHLTGAELYSINCNRCHAERFPTERTGAQWKTIMLHMQVRANIPAGQARLILQYLQENSGR